MKVTNEKKADEVFSFRESQLKHTFFIRWQRTISKIESIWAARNMIKIKFIYQLISFGPPIFRQTVQVSIDRKILKRQEAIKDLQLIRYRSFDAKKDIIPHSSQLVILGYVSFPIFLHMFSSFILSFYATGCSRTFSLIVFCQMYLFLKQQITLGSSSLSVMRKNLTVLDVIKYVRCSPSIHEVQNLLFRIQTFCSNIESIRIQNVASISTPLSHPKRFICI